MRPVHVVLATVALLSACKPDGGLSVYTSPPVVTILTPATGEEFDEGETIGFEAVVGDDQDLTGDLGLTWTSDLDGLLSEEGRADEAGRVVFNTASLTPGDHVVTLVVSDSDGDTAEDFVTITVHDLPDPPSIQILSPIVGDTGVEGEDFPFAAYVSDAQDEPGDLVVTFRSDVDGDFCTPTPDVSGRAECDATLSPGPHVLTFEAVDTEGFSMTATQAFTVTYAIDIDDDSDGYTERMGDCDDTDPSTHPTATESPNEVDDDCDGTTDEDTLVYDDDGDGYSEIGGDCDDTEATVFPSGTEVCDSLDNDCDTKVDEGTSCVDDDLDGWTELAGDCDDADAKRYPGLVETCDTKDNDCDGTVDDGTECYDDDGDGMTEVGGDCDDADPARYTGYTETCDSKDNDCDSIVDETTACYDDDGDGYTENGGDCDDAEDTAYPSAPELPDTIDNDCDGVSDEGTDLYDDDGDCRCESAPCTASIEPTCATIDGDDCDDDDIDVTPDADEVCNSVDDNCDGTTDESTALDAGTYYRDADGDGYGSTTSAKSCSKPSGYASVSGDCDDATSTTNPGASESCNSVDDDCDTTIDEGVTTTYYRDADGDGYGTSATSKAACSKPSGYVTSSTDCNDSDSTLNPATVWYIDADGDGYGTTTYTLTQCAAPTGYVRTKTDCNDLKSDAYPGATEKCDTYDNDCDSSVDEESASGCSTYYLDNDADAYGSTTSKCLCSASGKYTVTNKTDCYDSNANAKPGAYSSSASSWPTTSRGDGSSDYNCDGVQEKKYTTSYSCYAYCVSWTAGWSSSAPSCASSGTWVSSCDYEWYGPCKNGSTYTGSQECR